MMEYSLTLFCLIFNNLTEWALKLYCACVCVVGMHVFVQCHPLKWNLLNWKFRIS